MWQQLLTDRKKWPLSEWLEPCSVFAADLPRAQTKTEGAEVSRWQMA